MKVLVLGEALLDMVVTEEREAGLSISACTGGSPANVAAATSVLGVQTSLVTILGEDIFGRHIHWELTDLGVHMQHSLQGGAHTLLAVVSVDEKGIPHYSFRMDQGFFDGSLDPLQDLSLDTYRLIHFGSLGLLFPEYRRVFLPVIEEAFQLGIPLSLDPNIRPVPGLDEGEYRELLLFFLKQVHLVKASDEDLRFLLGGDYLLQIQKLRSNKPTFITFGSKGSQVMQGEEQAFIEAEEVVVADTTGCGDAYMGGVISSLLKEDIWDLSALIKAGRRGSRTAGVVARYTGALTGIRKLPSSIL